MDYNKASELRRKATKLAFKRLQLEGVKDPRLRLVWDYDEMRYYDQLLGEAYVKCLNALDGPLEPDVKQRTPK